MNPESKMLEFVEYGKSYVGNAFEVEKTGS